MARAWLDWQVAVADVIRDTWTIAAVQPVIQWSHAPLDEPMVTPGPDLEKGRGVCLVSGSPAARAPWR